MIFSASNVLSNVKTAAATLSLMVKHLSRKTRNQEFDPYWWFVIQAVFKSIQMCYTKHKLFQLFLYVGNIAPMTQNCMNEKYKKLNIIILKCSSGPLVSKIRLEQLSPSFLSGIAEVSQTSGYEFGPYWWFLIRAAFDLVLTRSAVSAV